MIRRRSPFETRLLWMVGLLLLAWRPPSGAAETDRYSLQSVHTTCEADPSRYSVDAASLSSTRFVWKGADTGACCPCSDVIFADGFENGTTAFWGPISTTDPNHQGGHHDSPLSDRRADPVDADVPRTSRR